MMVAIPFIFIAGIYQVKNNFRPAKYFVYAWFFLLFGNFLTGLMASGVLPSIFIVRLAGVIGFGIELLLLSIGLADRFNLIQEEALNKEEEARMMQANYAKALKKEVNLKVLKSQIYEYKRFVKNKKFINVSSFEEHEKTINIILNKLKSYD